MNLVPVATVNGLFNAIYWCCECDRKQKLTDADYDGEFNWPEYCIHSFDPRIAVALLCKIIEQPSIAVFSMIDLLNWLWLREIWSWWVYKFWFWICIETTSSWKYCRDTTNCYDKITISHAHLIIIGSKTIIPNIQWIFMKNEFMQIIQIPSEYIFSS